MIENYESPRELKVFLRDIYFHDKIRISKRDLLFVSHHVAEFSTLFMMINDLMRSKLIRTKICDANDANSKNCHFAWKKKENVRNSHHKPSIFRDTPCEHENK